MGDRWPLPTDADRRAAWVEHCAPLLESGRAALYGSPEHLERAAAKRAEKAAKQSGRQAATEEFAL